MISSTFLVTALIVVLLPGTGAVYTISAGLVHGWRAALAAALGCTLGIVPHVAASIGGLAAVLHLSAVAFHGLTWAGAAYMLYLAWAMWREQSTLGFTAAAPSTTARQIITKAIVLNLLNPKLTLFFVAFLPLFIVPNDPAPTATLCVLSAVFMALTFGVFAAYGALASSMRRSIAGSPRVLVWLRRSCAAAFAVLAVRLVLAER